MKKTKEYPQKRPNAYRFDIEIKKEQRLATSEISAPEDLRTDCYLPHDFFTLKEARKLNRITSAATKYAGISLKEKPLAET